MAFNQLNKHDRTAFEALADRLEDKRAELLRQGKLANDYIQQMLADLKEAERAYNEVVEEANELLSQTFDRAQDTASKRTEAWRDSDAGDRFATWADAFNLELEQAAIVWPDPVEVEVDVLNENVRSLRDLPTAPEGAPKKEA